MKTQEYSNMYASEEQHFFYKPLHDFILYEVKKYTGDFNGKKLRLLDAGCGTGLLAKKLKQFGTVQAIDIHPLAIEFSGKRGVKATKASVTHIPFKAATFDVITSIDVLYHRMVQKDTAALKELFRVLKKGGLLILRVSAHPFLFSAHDKQTHGKRRYRKNELRKKLVQAGFSVEKLTYSHGILFFPSLINALYGKDTPRSLVGKMPSWINALFVLFLSAEFLLLRKISLPVGIGLIAVCKKI